MDKSTRRVVIVVEEEGIKRGSRVRLWGYGYESIGRLVKRSRYTVKRDKERGVVDLGSLRSVVNYINERNK